MDINEYSNRLIVFIDVLGFGRLVELSAKDSTQSEQLIKRIANAILTSSNELISGSNRGNYMFTQFSDSLVISTPYDRTTFEHQFFVLSLIGVIYEFLQHDLLLRGGVTLGKLIHTDVLLFGPAMNRAYQIESNLAKFPRIVIDEQLADLFSGTLMQGYIKLDYDGLRYINYFNPIKAFYLVPGWLNKIKEIILNMPADAQLKDKREWLIKKYNEAISNFSFDDFQRRLERRAEDELHIARGYDEFLADAMNLKKISL